jgi:hypothetical protein
MLIKEDNKMKKFIVTILVLVSVGGMYYFSSQDGQVSKNQSQAVVNLIDKVMDNVTLQDENLIKIQTKVYDKLKEFGDKRYIVRKMAHGIIDSNDNDGVAKFLMKNALI